MFAASTSYAAPAVGLRARPGSARTRRASHARAPIRAAIAEPTSTVKTAAAGAQAGLADAARHLIGCPVTQDTRVQSALDDVASSIRQATS